MRGNSLPSPPNGGRQLVGLVADGWQKVSIEG